MRFMSALDTAKEIARITVTSGLSTEIITLLEKKIALLTEQITTLESENANLKDKADHLERELEHLRPKTDLDEQTVGFLKLMFDDDQITVSQIADMLKISKGMAEYHRDILVKAEMIRFPNAIKHR